MPLTPDMLAGEELILERSGGKWQVYLKRSKGFSKTSIIPVRLRGQRRVHETWELNFCCSQDVKITDKERKHKTDDVSNAFRLKDPASISEREERLKCEFVEEKMPSTWRSQSSD